MSGQVFYFSCHQLVHTVGCRTCVDSPLLEARKTSTETNQTNEEEEEEEEEHARTYLREQTEQGDTRAQKHIYVTGKIEFQPKLNCRQNGYLWNTLQAAPSHSKPLQARLGRRMCSVDRA